MHTILLGDTFDTAFKNNYGMNYSFENVSFLAEIDRIRITMKSNNLEKRVLGTEKFTGQPLSLKDALRCQIIYSKILKNT